jgi:thiamine kinase-like enzyme
LAACHEAMRDFSLELPRLGILYETLRLLQHSTLQNAFSLEEIGLLGEHLQRSTAALEHFPHQPLHGDAHLGNVIAGAQGVLWTDWEDAFSGPVEWDVASAIWNAKLLEADPLTENDILTGYTALGAKLDPAAMRHSLLARAAVMSAWYPVLYPNPDAARRQKLALRMAWLRQELSNPT